MIWVWVLGFRIQGLRLGLSHFQCGVRVWASGFRMRVLRLAALFLCLGFGA